MANIITFVGKTPDIHPESFTAVGANIIGDVAVAQYASIWFGATLRGDINFIRVGKYSNVQDGSVVHVDSPKPELPGQGAAIIGDYVTIGHGAIIHAATLEDCCLVGMGAIVLDGAVVGRGSIIGAGAVVTPNTVVPPLSLVLGTPGKAVKTLPEESIAERIAHGERYWELTKQYGQ